MQILNMNKYLFSIYAESVLKVFKHFNSMQVWSLSKGFYCVRFLIVKLILGNFRVN